MNHKQYSPDEWKALLIREEFVSVSEAKKTAFGSELNREVSLFRYYAAWQYLQDNNVTLEEADTLYLDKLICDGIVSETY